MRSTDAMYEIIYSANMHINHNLAQAFNYAPKYFITARNSSCGKVIYLQACVITSVHRSVGLASQPVSQVT